MRLLLAVLAFAFVLAPPAPAQEVVEAWYFIESDAGKHMVQAREIQTHTDARGGVRVLADQRAIRTDGPVFITPLGPSRERPDPPPQTQSDQYGSSKGLVNLHTSGKTFFTSWGMNVKYEGKTVTRMTDVMTNNYAATTTATSNSDGSTSTSTTTQENGNEDGGETGGGEETGGDTGGGETGGGATGGGND